MSKAFETTTDTAANSEFVTDPIPPTASKKRAWAWALVICGGAVAATLYFYPPSALFSSGGNKSKAIKLADVLAPKNGFTVLPGGTIAIVPFAANDEDWRVLLVPTHGNTKTIYYGDSDRAERIYAITSAMQSKANNTGAAQAVTFSSDGVAINKAIKN